MPSIFTGTDVSGDQPSWIYGNDARWGMSGDPGSLTIEGAAGQIGRWGGTWGVGATVTYAFRSTAPGTMPDDTTGFSQFNAAQIAATVLALQAWSDVANINFTRVGSGTGSSAYSNNASLLFSNYADGSDGAAAFAYMAPYRGSGGTAADDLEGDSWYNSTLDYNATPVLNGYGRHVLIHEIGHALGLSHPGDYNAGDGEEITYANAEYLQDSRQFTVMSYFSEVETGASFGGSYASAPLLDDIAAIQLLYGANMATRTGDTVYGFNSNTGRDFYSASNNDSRLIFSVWDAGGYDTLDFSGYRYDQVIDLRPGEFSNVGGLYGNVSIAQGAFIERAIGGSGNDEMYAAASVTAVAVADVSKAQSVENTSRGRAVSLEGHFGLQFDANIVSSTVIPHATVNATAAGGGLDYYAITVEAGQQITIDLDSTTNTFDAWVIIQNSSGSRVAYNDDGPTDAGSAKPQDSYLTYTFTTAGTYYIAVGQYLENSLNGGALVAGTRYTLNVSLTGEDAPISGLTGSRLDGGAGIDTLYGSDGADILNGGTDRDTMGGGKGDDLYYVDNVGDGVYEDAASGTDTVRSTIDYVLTDNVENLILEGSSNIDGSGNALDNSLTGNAGDNTLNGGAGADIMAGGRGNDRYYVDNRNDQVIEARNAGHDKVFTSISYTLGDNIEDLSASGTADVKLVGNDLNNTINGNRGANNISGGAGADVMAGGRGHDNYWVDNVGDQVIELAGEGTDRVYSTVSFTLGANVEKLTLKGEAWINGTGNDLNNTMSGNLGRNVLTGGLGADTLTGKAGSDTFVWTSIEESKAERPDVVTDLNDNSDKIDFRQLDGDVNTAGVQGFDIVDAFSGRAGELVLSYDAATNITALTVDVNGDGQSDMLIHLIGNHETFERFLFGGG